MIPSAPPRWRGLLHLLGPGLITGDPSGIATYSQAGAQVAAAVMFATSRV